VIFRNFAFSFIDNMLRIGGASNSIVPVRQLILVLVTRKSYACTTKRKELEWVLSVRGIKLPNFTYEFSLP
ncbi:hypothetical protein J1N35_023082, partial [Gossypium stocksii]